jgi:hypothetical protein
MERQEPSASVSFNNFTPKALKALALAREEAVRLHHSFVGTEHVLLGLIKVGKSVASNVLERMGLDLESTGREIERQIGVGPDEKVAGHVPYTPRVKRVLSFAGKEAQALSHQDVGTEHILLGLMREGDGVAAQVLKTFEVDLEKTRTEILRELDPNFQGTPEARMQALRELAPNFHWRLVNKMASEEGVTGSEYRSVDTTKRYDVYCNEGGERTVIYRNALFIRRRRLLSKGPHDIGADYVELEVAEGKRIYVLLLSVVKFCEPGEKGRRWLKACFENPFRCRSGRIRRLKCWHFST